ncbi:MAG TPA: YiiX/YebB-like N1pC/P60 family cysteine hydrolase [Chroococcales cyanobacterium]
MIKLSKTLAISTLLFTFLFSGCGTITPSANLRTSSADSAIQAESLSNPDKTELLSNVNDNAETFSEGVKEPQSASTGSRGNLIYRALAGSRILRSVGYLISAIPVQIKFNKPGKKVDPDPEPRMGSKEVETLLASLQPGDVIQCGNNGSFVHAIFYLGMDEIVHALAQPGNGKKMSGVIEEKLSGYFARVERDKVVVLRPHWTPEKLADALAYAKAQVGKDYDTLFLSDSDDRFYCTELVYSALKHSGVSKVAPHLTKRHWLLVTNEDFRSCPDLEVVYRFRHE